MPVAINVGTTFAASALPLPWRERERENESDRRGESQKISRFYPAGHGLPGEIVAMAVRRARSGGEKLGAGE
jgi:hypothetical protein